MNNILNNEQFTRDYLRLKDVTLNPRRHTAANAYQHCQMVARRVLELAGLNHYTAEQSELLLVLAKVHDIGKLTGSARPQASLELIQTYEEIPEVLLNLVKYHDINLPWFIAHQKGQSPSDKAWRKLARSVDLHLLLLFMIADRVDCPGGWTENEALMWFKHQLERRGLISMEIIV